MIGIFVLKSTSNAQRIRIGGAPVCKSPATTMPGLGSHLDACDPQQVPCKQNTSGNHKSKLCKDKTKLFNIVQTWKHAPILLSRNCTRGKVDKHAVMTTCSSARLSLLGSAIMHSKP